VIKDECKPRIKNIIDGMPGNCDAIFLWSDMIVDKNLTYVTGFTSSKSEGAAVLLEKSGKITLFSPSRDQELNRRQASYDEFVVWSKIQERDEMLKKILPKFYKIGLCFGSLLHSSYRTIEEIFVARNSIFDVTDLFAKRRSIKSPDEIDKIKRACEIVSRLTVILPTFLHEGMSEMDLAAEVEYHMKKMGSDDPAFSTIVAFEKNTSVPHHSSGTTTLMKDDVVLIDFGAEVEGYKSDITQVYFMGTPDRWKKHMYNKVLEAQLLAISMIKPGIKSEDVIKEAKKITTGYGRYKNSWIHGLGHGIGLDIHDSQYPDVFEENMVLTVEPGIYLPGDYGVRLEDDILVTKGGCEVLTHTLKKRW